jgi:hypothetical protein
MGRVQAVSVFICDVLLLAGAFACAHWLAHTQRAGIS